MEVLVRYKQEFMGELLFNGYTTYIDDELDKLDIERALYSDPHVISVEIIELESEKQ